MTTTEPKEKGKLHFIGHRELGILLAYQFRNDKNEAKLKIANISRDQIIEEAGKRKMTPGELFAEIARHLAETAMALDYKNGITDQNKDQNKVDLIVETADTVLNAMEAGQTVSDADFSFVVDVDGNNSGGFSMTRMSTDGGPVSEILNKFSLVENHLEFLTDMPKPTGLGGVLIKSK